MKVLVCGAGGFVASHLSKELLEMGHEVRAVDIKWDGYMPQRYYSEKRTLDLRLLSSCRKAVEDVDWVFQLAADMGGIGYITQHAADITHNNILINTYMLEAALEAKVKRFLFSSSACVYPNFKQTTSDVKGLKESDAVPADPNEAYGWEKLFTEQMVAAYAKDCGLDVRVVRYHNIFGPMGTYDGGREKSPAALCRKVAMAKDNGEIEIWGDGSATRSYCYIQDAVRGTLALMNSDYTEPINIGSDRLVSVNDLADIIIGISGKSLKKKYIDGPIGVMGRNADLTLVKEVLGWQPQVSLEDGLAKTYTWIKRQVEKD